MEFSLQLYSLACGGVSDVIKEIEIAGEHGYNGVEFAGFGDYTTDELKEALKKNNLYSKSAHTSFADKSDAEIEEMLKFHKELGIEYMIQPWFSYETKEKVTEIITALNHVSELAKKYGIKVGYHNHNQEFEKIDDKYILDLLKEGTNEDVVFEIDVFWVTKGGEDPYKIIEKFGKRVELVHLKQADKDGNNVDIEDGVIDVNKVREAAKYAKYFIVEQEATGDSIKSSKHNADYLKTL